MKVRSLKGIIMYGQDYVNNNIKVGKSRIHGKGVITNKEYEAGSEAAYFEGYEIGYDTRHSLTFNDKKIEPTGPLMYLNHSCEPNSYFRGRTLVTNRRVKSGEELTINYLETESNISYSFECKCKTKKCKKKIFSVVSR